MKATNTLKGMKANLVGMLQREASVLNHWAKVDPEVWPNAADKYAAAQAAVWTLIELADYAGMDIRVTYNDVTAKRPYYVKITVDNEVVLEGK